MMEADDDLVKIRLGIAAADDLVPIKSSDGKETLTYLDYAGCPLVSRTLLSDVANYLSCVGLDNPHSGGTASNAIVNEVRRLTLDHFGLSNEDYCVIFTSGSTHALKMIGDVFPWSSGSQFSYSKNAHNSLMGIRTLAPKFSAISLTANPRDNREGIDLDMNSNLVSNEELLEWMIFRESKFPWKGPHCCLLGTPAECNFNGSVLNLQSTAAAVHHRNKHQRDNQQWFWLVDAARASSPKALGDSSLPHRPDFITLSYYKIFGYPTGIGALVVKREIMPKLKKRYFGGGTLLAGAADSSFLVPRPVSSHEHFEDGTLNIHGLVGVMKGFAFLERLGGMEAIREHSHRLYSHLLEQMNALHHSNGQPLCTIYSLTDRSRLSSSSQGPILTFNLSWMNGLPIGFYHVKEESLRHNIYIRCGCFCNLGGCQDALQLSAKDNEHHYALGRTCSSGGEDLDVINNHHTGACRLSLGYGSTIQDCDRFITFLKIFVDQLPSLPLSLRQDLVALGNDREADGSPSSQLFWQTSALSFPNARTAHDPPASIDSSRETKVVLKALYVYPIKSCGGIRIDHWPVTRQGLLFDRWFAIINADTGSVLTQKQCPRLALIKPTIEFPSAIDGPSSAWILQVAAEDWPTVLQIPLLAEQDTEPSMNGKEDGVALKNAYVKMRICGRCTSGRTVSTNASEWFTRFINNDEQAPADLDKPKANRYTLIRSDNVSPSRAPAENSSEPLTFANTAQYLMLSIQSLQALIEMMKKEAKEQREEQDRRGEGTMEASFENVRVENFRPNVVIDAVGSAPHVEDSFACIALPMTGPQVSGELTSFQITGPCARCLMVNVNSRNGKMDCKVLEALRTYRYADRSIYFGQFLSLGEKEMMKIAVAGGAAEDFEKLPRLSVGSCIEVTLR